MTNFKFTKDDLEALERILLGDIKYRQDMVRRFPSLAPRVKPDLDEGERLLVLLRQLPRLSHSR